MRDKKLELKKVHTVHRSFFEKKYNPVVLKKDILFKLEKTIPAKVLFDAVKELEVKLKDRSIEQGYELWHDDLEEPEYQDEFSHILEHAIVAVVDNNLSTASTMSTGYTTVSGLVDRKGSADSPKDFRFFYGREVKIFLSPTVPPSVREKYVLFIVKEISGQYVNTGKIDLTKIKLS